MTYATKSDLIAAFGEQEITRLLDKNNNGSEDASTFDLAAQRVGAEINSMLGARYSTPVPRSTLVVGWACDMTRYYLFDKRATDIHQKRYDLAIAQISRVAKGRSALPAGIDGTLPTELTDGITVDEMFASFDDDIDLGRYEGGW